MTIKFILIVVESIYSRKHSILPQWSRLFDIIMYTKSSTSTLIPVIFAHLDAWKLKGARNSKTAGLND